MFPVTVCVTLLRKNRICSVSISSRSFICRLVTPERKAVEIKNFKYFPLVTWPNFAITIKDWNYGTAQKLKLKMLIFGKWMPTIFKSSAR